jgi:pantothenate kinase
LLQDTQPWLDVRAALDECWWVALDDGERRGRLIDRHVQFGKPRPAAERWVDRSDRANARMVADDWQRADLVVSGELSVYTA